VLPPKDTTFVVRLTIHVGFYTFAGGEARGLSEEVLGGPGVQGFVIYVGRRIGSGFCSSHLKEKANKREKEGRNEGLVEDDGATRRNPEKRRNKGGAEEKAEKA